MSTRFVTMSTEALRIILAIDIEEVFIETTMICDDLNNSLDILAAKAQKLTTKVKVLR